MEFQNQFNRDKFLKGRREKRSLLPSETVPDQTLSISEIMRRYASGQPVGGMREPIYNGEEILPEFERMDLAERAEYLEANRQEITELETKLKQHNDKVKKSKQKKEKEAENESK